MLTHNNRYRHFATCRKKVKVDFQTKLCCDSALALSSISVPLRTLGQGLSCRARLACTVTMSDDCDRPPTRFERFINKYLALFNGPTGFVREKIVVPLQKNHSNVYYHRQYQRVPNIDECEIGDQVCFHEANIQFKRDKDVENQILAILRQRTLECQHWYGADAKTECEKIFEDYETATTNWFTKYGDLGAAGTVRDAYFKQKHRLIWERRHGPVGSGMKAQ